MISVTAAHIAVEATHTTVVLLRARKVKTPFAVA
jgi:hypothetical protein